MSLLGGMNTTHIDVEKTDVYVNIFPYTTITSLEWTML